MSELQDSNNLGEDGSQTIHDLNTWLSSEECNDQMEAAAIAIHYEMRPPMEGTNEVVLEEVGEQVDAMCKACFGKDWGTFETFLSDESISKRKKNRFLEEYCRDFALRHGAPVSLIKRLVEIEGTDAISKGHWCSWLHTVMLCSDTTFEVVKLLVDIGGKDLVNMQYNHREHRNRTALHIHLGLSAANSKPVELSRKIIDLLARVGGMELLEIEDDDGYRVLDYCLEDERSVIIKCLKSSYEENFGSVQEHVRLLQSTKVTPKQIEYWIWNAEYDKLDSYLDSKEVSREAKQRCFNYRDSDRNRFAFFEFCLFHGPLDIAERIIDLMGSEFLMTTDNNGDTCLHAVCKNCEDDDDTECQHMLVELLLEQGGPALLCAKNKQDKTALLHLLHCKKTNFDCITLMVDIGGKDFLLKTDMFDCTVLHEVSMSDQIEPKKDIILYLLSKGGSDLREIKDISGKKAEDYWSPELKQYIDLHTKPSLDLPPLSDDLQCPICFEIMNDVHMIPQCCHRFCKKCITDAFYRNGKKCPVCRVEYSIGEVRKDPLLCKFAILVQEKENELKKANEKNDALREEKEDKLTKANEQNKILNEQFAMLKRKYNEM